jgi:hypothetical protein
MARFRRRPTKTETADLAALKAELTLLREENARLAVALASEPGAGRAVDRMRAAADAASGSDEADDAWAAIGEAFHMKETLLNLFYEFRKTLVVLEQRVEALELPARSQPMMMAIEGGSSSMEGV